LVNHRKPRQRSCCATCCAPIHENYLRDITTQLTYCGFACYAGRRTAAALAIENRAKAS
jgi:hypothetical protein